MVLRVCFFKVLCLLIVATIVSGCSEKEPVKVVEQQKSLVVLPAALDVFKSPTCGCCGKWVEHVEGGGFAAETHHPDDLNGLKQQLGVAAQFQSCHTAVSKDGYVFEGHIPTDIMQRFLAEKPAGALGLAVPGMPMGSPGMEMGDRRDSYDVLLLMKDGSARVYQHVAAGF